MFVAGWRHALWCEWPFIIIYSSVAFIAFLALQVLTVVPRSDLVLLLRVGLTTRWALPQVHGALPVLIHVNNSMITLAR